jgi:hypothetical protein
MILIAYPLMTIFGMITGYKTETAMKVYAVVWVGAWFFIPMQMFVPVLLAGLYFGGVMLFNKVKGN